MDTKTHRLLAEREAAEERAEYQEQYEEQFEGLTGEEMDRMLADADNYGADAPESE